MGESRKYQRWRTWLHIFIYSKQNESNINYWRGQTKHFGGRIITMHGSVGNIVALQAHRCIEHYETLHENYSGMMTLYVFLIFV